MQQLFLFPPPAAPSKPLPDDVRDNARSLLSDLLVAVMTATPLNQKLLEDKREDACDE